LAEGADDGYGVLALCVDGLVEAIPIGDCQREVLESSSRALGKPIGILGDLG
jgi:hypothetical protein